MRDFKRLQQDPPAETSKAPQDNNIMNWKLERLVYADESICLDILQNQRSPIYDVAAILTSIQSLLCDPNLSFPVNSEAARMISENNREYNRWVSEIVE